MRAAGWQLAHVRHLRRCGASREAAGKGFEAVATMLWSQAQPGSPAQQAFAPALGCSSPPDKRENSLVKLVLHQALSVMGIPVPGAVLESNTTSAVRAVE